MSQLTLGSSCATLQDGLAYMANVEDEQSLLKQLQDPTLTVLEFATDIKLKPSTMQDIDLELEDADVETTGPAAVRPLCVFQKKLEGFSTATQVEKPPAPEEEQTLPATSSDFLS